MTETEMNKIADMVVEKLLVKLAENPEPVTPQPTPQTVPWWPQPWMPTIDFISKPPNWYWADPHLYNPFGVGISVSNVDPPASTNSVGA